MDHHHDAGVFNHEPDGYSCPFCRNIRNGAADHPLEVIYRDDDVLVKMNPRWYPNNPGAVLVVPIEHHENIYGLPERLGLPIQRAVRAAAIAMKSAFECDGVSTRQHNEPAGDQEVWHHHVHVFPRWDGDDLYGSTNGWADHEQLRQRAGQPGRRGPAPRPWRLRLVRRSCTCTDRRPPAEPTIAERLAGQTGFSLFHNHLTVNALAPVFGFGTKPFGDVLHRLRLDVFATAAAAGTSLIFTNNSAWSGPNSRERFCAFAAEADAVVGSAGGRVLFVNVTAPAAVLEARLANDSRRGHGKFLDIDRLRVLLDGLDDYPLHATDLTIDSSVVSPEEAAATIATHLTAM